jgi:hypothetical protein
MVISGFYPLKDSCKKIIDPVCLPGLILASIG